MAKQDKSKEEIEKARQIYEEAKRRGNTARAIQNKPKKENK